MTYQSPLCPEIDHQRPRTLPPVCSAVSVNRRSSQCIDHNPRFNDDHKEKRSRFARLLFFDQFPSSFRH